MSLSNAVCFGKFPDAQFTDDNFNERSYLSPSSSTSELWEANNSCLNGSTDDLSGPFRIPKRHVRPIANNAARERTRVKTLRSAFLELQRTLPAVPPDTKLSKLDVLVLATTYIAHLMSALHENGDVSHIFAANGCMHPVKKWPMRTRLYAGILTSTLPHGPETEGHTTTSDVRPFTWSHDHSN